MKKFTAILSFLGILLFVPQMAQARAPDCGDIKRTDIEPTFDAADYVWLYHNVGDDLNDMCLAMEALEEWHDALPKEERTARKFKEAYKELVAQSQKSITSFRPSLISLRGWLKHNPGGSVEKAKRIVKVKAAKKRLSILQRKIVKQRDAVMHFMKDQAR